MYIITGFYHGHAVYCTEYDKTWRYKDTEEPIKEVPIRPCPKCGGLPTKDGHDPCIANLPSVKNACCGHGQENGYVSFENGQTIRGKFD